MWKGSITQHPACDPHLTPNSSDVSQPASLPAIFPTGSPFHPFSHLPRGLLSILSPRWLCFTVTRFLAYPSPTAQLWEAIQPWVWVAMRKWVPRGRNWVCLVCLHLQHLRKWKPYNRRSINDGWTNVRWRNESMTCTLIQMTALFKSASRTLCYPPPNFAPAPLPHTQLDSNKTKK